jgi:MFS family permease
LKRYLVIVMLFGFVSMFADMTYEGARSILPQYLGYLGANLAVIGFLGGFGEFASYLLRFVSGLVSSKYGLLWTLTISGYMLTGLSVALIAIAPSWVYVALLTIMERIAKGLRTPPRDALISIVAAKGRSGRAFGLHGAIDQVGAVLGPLIAAYMLASYGFSPLTFVVLSVFSFIAVSILIYTRSIYPRDVEVTPRKPVIGILRGPLTLYNLSISIPALSSISLFVAIYWVGRSDPLIGVMYFIAIQVIEILMSIVLGELYDKIGIRAIYIYYMIIPLTTLGLILNPLLLLIGVIFAIENSIQKAVIGDLARGNEPLAYGYYHMVYGIALAVGGYIVGLLAQQGLIDILLALSLSLSILGAMMMRVTIRITKAGGYSGEAV